MSSGRTVHLVSHVLWPSSGRLSLTGCVASWAAALAGVELCYAVLWRRRTLFVAFLSFPLQHSSLWLSACCRCPAWGCHAYVLLAHACQVELLPGVAILCRSAPMGRYSWQYLSLIRRATPHAVYPMRKFMVHGCCMHEFDAIKSLVQTRP